MALGAIFDAGGDIEAADRAVVSVDGAWSLHLEEVLVSSVRCLAASVAGGPSDKPRQLTQSAMTSLITTLDLTARAQDMIRDVYRNLFLSESAVHGTPLAETKLHESGSGSNLALLAAACAGLAELDLTEVSIGQIALGSGALDNPTHGLLPIPPPAVLHLLAGYEVTSGPVPGERVTPTSAALIRATAAPGQMPSMKVQQVGRGADGLNVSGGFASLLVGVRP